MADFHAADLWVAVIPDTKQVGPAMEKAGKEAKDKFGGGVKDFGKTIIDDLEKVKAKTKDVFADAGKGVGDSFKKAGKTASDSFSTEFKTGAKDLGKVLLEEYGPVLGEELGKAIGGKIGDALHDIPGMDTVRDVMDQVAQYAPEAAEAFQNIRDAINATKTGDYTEALKGFDGALHSLEPVAKNFGIDISGWIEPLDKVTDGFSKSKGNIKETTDNLMTLTSNSGKISGGITAIGNAAGPLAIAFEGLKMMPGWMDSMNKVMSGKGGFMDVLNTNMPALQLYLNILRQFRDTPPPPAPGSSPPVPSPTSPGAAPGPGQPGALPPGWEYGPGGIPIKKKAGGGAIDGPGAIGKDSVLMWGAPGEHMWTAPEVDAAGGHNAMYGLRALARAGAFRDMKGYDGGGAPGGDVGPGGGANLANLYRYAQSLVGIPYSQATRNDCSGMVSKLVNVALGLPPAASFTTQSEQSYLLSHGFIMGNGPPGSFRVGWYNHGSGADDGHTAATLPDGTHAESGGAHGAFLLGAGAAGAENSEFDMHAYLPMNPQGDAISGASAGRGGGGGGSGLGGGGAGGGGLAGGGGGGGGSASEQGQQFGAGIVGGVLQATGLDGSVFKSFTGKGPMDWGITKLAGGLIGELTKTSTKPGGAGPPGAGGILGGLIGSLPGGEAISALAQAAQPGGAAGGAAGGTTNIDNSFTVNGVGSVPEQKQAANAYQAQVAAAPVNP